ncbi:MAG TPA: iron donor protein CyaY [Usitatibacteraceae bacterium]
MADTLQMDESEFHQRVDAILEAIESALDDVEADIDAERNGGILTLTFGNDSKVIVNRQTPNREIWVAAKSGGFHFRWVAKGGVHGWYDTRSEEPLARLLSRVISMQSENVIAITL